KADWLVRLTDEPAARLEQHIDAMTEQLAPLQNFILPGGTVAAATLHVARTVCRRAERLSVALSQGAAINPAVIQYLNRLSDFLFDLARWVNAQSGEDEQKWAVRG